MRLVENGQVVGYARNSGRLRLFSADGYGWSGTPISFDYEAPQVPFRFGRERIFHGDTVRLPERSGEQSLVERIVVVTDRGDVLLMDGESEYVERLSDLWPPPSTARVHETTGSLATQPQWQQRLDHAAREASATGTLHGLKLFGVTSSIVAGLLVASGLQWMTIGHVGPVFSLTGGLFGSLLFWRGLRRWNWSALRRKQMLKLSLQSGLCLALLGVLFAATGLGLPEWNATVASMTTVVAGHGVLGLFIGIICTTLGADLVAWRTGGYADERREALGFRHSS